MRRATVTVGTVVLAALAVAPPAAAAERIDLTDDVVATNGAGHGDHRDAAPGEARPAFKIGGRRWPRGRIRYHVRANQHRGAVRAAARAWNRSGAKVRFVAVKKRRAQVTVRYNRAPAAGSTCGYGFATLGQAPGAFVVLPRLANPGPEARYACTQVAVHEFGHVLGLAHEEGRCATMNAVSVNLSPQRCPPNEQWEWRCRLLEPDDVRGAVRLYGGKAKPVQRKQMCDLYPPSPPVSGLTAVLRHGATYARWQRPASPVPSWLSRRLGPSGSYRVAAERDRCPTLGSGPNYGYSTAIGGWEEAHLALGAPGRYCVAVRTVDELGRPGQTAQVWHDHTASELDYYPYY